MSTINCPTCHRPFVVAPGYAGHVVTCPACRYPLTVPHVSPLAPPAPEPLTLVDDAPRRFVPRQSSFLPVMVAGLCFVVIVAAAVGGWVYVTLSDDKAQKDAATDDAKRPPAKSGESARKPADPKSAKTTPPEPAPPEPKPEPTFDEAYATALTVGAALDAAEPKTTAEAFKILAGVEPIEFRNVRDRPEMLSHPGVAATMRRLGMTGHLEKLSRTVARTEPEFKTVAKVLWEPPSGHIGILQMMNTWGTISRFQRNQVASVVLSGIPTNQLTPALRNSILELGGRRWLAR